MNKVILIGRLTKDLELKKTTSGKSFVNFSVAVDRPFNNAQGQREADFINCIAWNKTAENMSSFVGKGSLIAVDGRIQTRNYENNEGKRVYVTEVVAEFVQFLGSKSGSTTTQAKPVQSNNNDDFFGGIDEKTTSSNDFLSNLEINEDELPF